MPRPFSHKYSPLEMYSLNKAYFNQSNNKFEPLERFEGQFASDRARKTFAHSYRNRQGQKFSVFIPSYLQVPDERTNRYDLLLSEALVFIADYKKNRKDASKENEVFLIPLMDMTQMHWTVLQVKLGADDKVEAVHYDGMLGLPFSKKAATEREIRKQVNTLLNAPLSAPILARQIDPISCGPLSHDIIRELGKGKSPTALPRIPFNYGIRDFALLDKARRFDRPDVWEPTFAIQADFEIPATPFLVRHHSKILWTVVFGGVAAIAAILILFPPAGIIATGVTAAVAWSGLSTGVFAAAASAAIVVAGPIVTKLITSIPSAFKAIANFFSPRTLKTLNYADDRFSKIPYKPSRVYSDHAPNPAMYRRDYLQMEPLEGERRRLLDVADKTQPSRESIASPGKESGSLMDNWMTFN